MRGTAGTLCELRSHAPVQSWCNLADREGYFHCRWDRKVEGGFPELKILVSRTTQLGRAARADEGVWWRARSQKQRIRNLIEPEKDLGHSGKQPSEVKTDKVAAQPTPASEKTPAASSDAPGAEWVPTVADYEPRFRC